jgi:hypothetical protein
MLWYSPRQMAGSYHHFLSWEETSVDRPRYHHEPRGDSGTVNSRLHPDQEFTNGELLCKSYSAVQYVDTSTSSATERVLLCDLVFYSFLFKYHCVSNCALLSACSTVHSSVLSVSLSYTYILRYICPFCREFP